MSDLDQRPTLQDEEVEAWLVELLELEEKRKIKALTEPKTALAWKSKGWHYVRPVSDRLVEVLLNQEPRIWPALASNQALQRPQAIKMLGTVLARVDEEEVRKSAGKVLEKLIARLGAKWDDELVQKIDKALAGQDFGGLSVKKWWHREEQDEKSKKKWEQVLVQVLATVPGAPPEFLLRNAKLCTDPKTLAGLLNIPTVGLNEVRRFKEFWDENPSMGGSYYWSRLFLFWEKERRAERPDWLDKLPVQVVADALFKDSIINQKIWLNWLNEKQLNTIVGAFDQILQKWADQTVAGYIQDLDQEQWARLSKPVLAKLLTSPKKAVRETVILKCGQAMKPGGPKL